MSDNDPGFLLQIGIKLPDLIAGFFGGVVNAFVMKRSDPWSIIGSIAVGAIMANYLSETISNYLGTKPGTAGFVVGVTGMVLAQGLIEASRSWRPFGKGGGDVRSGS